MALGRQMHHDAASLGVLVFVIQHVFTLVGRHVTRIALRTIIAARSALHIHIRIVWLPNSGEEARGTGSVQSSSFSSSP
jgi:hypothetical protein